MRKLLLLTATILLAFGIAVAQSKINPAGNNLLLEYKISRDKSISVSSDNKIYNHQSEPVVTSVVLLKENVDDSILNSFNLEILSSLDGVVVIACPITVCEKVAELPEVISVAFGDTLKPMLDFARSSSGVETVQNGFEYNGRVLSYDGKGVICGMFDTGLEANHINFKNPDGSSRIKRLWHMNSSDGSSIAYDASNISKFTTDNSSGSHATHVAGILGGGYKGVAEYGYLTTASGNTGSIVKGGDIPYYGVATNADLAFGVGTLSNANVIQGLTNIIEYAESSNQPVVINLSIGTNIGPHDGTDVYCQSLSRLAKNSIICVAAGNEGDQQISVSKTLGAAGNNAFLRTFPMSVYQNGTLAYGIQSGIVDLWSNDATPVKFSLKMFKGDIGKAEVIVEVDEAGQTVRSQGNAVFDNYFTGSYVIQSTVDPNNNRYQVYVTFNNVELKNGLSNMGLMIEVSGAQGTELNMFGNDIVFDNRCAAGTSTTVACTKGSGANSISNLACAKGLISVGSFTSRTTWLQLDQSVYTYQANSGFSVGQVSPFSSYGTAFKGEQLPLICAPGANIVSSYSKYCVNSNNASTMIAQAANGKDTDYWNVMQGTSMACPYVTGTIGLWLQADPSLDESDVADIIKTTSIAPPLGTKGTLLKQWGGGKLDALAGIKEVLRRKGESGGIDGVLADAEGYVITPVGDRGFNVVVDGAGVVSASLYNLQGVAVARAEAQGNEVTLEADGVAPGVYVLSIETPNTARIARRILLR